MPGYQSLAAAIAPASFSQYSSDPRWALVDSMLQQLFAAAAGSFFFNSSVSATLSSGTTYSNYDPAGYTPGTTNRLVLTPTGSNQTLDGLTAPGTDGFPLFLWNASLTYSLVVNDQNFAGNASSTGNKFACPNPNSLAANAIEIAIPPQSGVMLVYVNNVWTFAS